MLYNAFSHSLVTTSHGEVSSSTSHLQGALFSAVTSYARGGIARLPSNLAKLDVCSTLVYFTRLLLWTTSSMHEDWASR